MTTHSEPVRSDVHRAAKRRGLVAGLIAVGAVGADFAVSGALGFSLVVVLVAAAFASVEVGRLLRAGTAGSPRSGGSAGQVGRAETGEYRGHAAAVRGTRGSRAAILRHFQALSRVEQERFPDLLEAVDAVALGVERDARRLGALDEREAELVSGPPGSGRATGEPLAGEIAEARERITGDLREGVEALEQIRHWLVRSGGADSAAVHDQLVGAVTRALAVARRREG